MAQPIEDYAIIGDCHTVALVGKDGSIDWLCFPRFDSPACFAALLGTPDHGRWLLAPAVEVRRVRRRYLPGTLVLETEFTTAAGDAVAVIDFMPRRSGRAEVVRVVEGRRGTVPMRTELVVRFDYGSAVPWVRKMPDFPHALQATAGPDTLYCRAEVDFHGEGMRSVADFTVSPGQRLCFELTWKPTYQSCPDWSDPIPTPEDTVQWWRQWAAKGTFRHGPAHWQEAVERSLITLKALTYAPTGGIAAAATTSLPEHIGGVRNWDYRYCWLRDATFTLTALMGGGYAEEARKWREWLVNAVAGTPDKLQIMYGVTGERRLTELELPWLPGYENSRPVRIGNGAYSQHQLDVYGEVMDAMHAARRHGLPEDANAWNLQRAIARFVETDWDQPDEGIWEVRGPRQHFVHSKVMAWVAMDRAVKAVEESGLPGEVDCWRRIRQQIHDEVCAKGFDSHLNAFTQAYGSKEPDASLLMLPLVGFLPATDPRIRGTVDFIQQTLSHGGFVHRYRTEQTNDGLPGGEGVFLLCTFWLADCLALMGRKRESAEIFERLLALRNDVGLLAEEYDPHAQRQLGNFPQAFSHIGLINTALNLTPAAADTPAIDRPG
ncbi:MAG TPA: glycoside hydrolase family 15 protein [Tepidisphaeraceae bacterium]|nr:glycoside hydrolase family 15 protein [Tepidisphaeraceae bacterium]